MKKRLSIVGFVLFTLALMVGFPATAATYSQHGPIYVFIDGKEPALSHDPILNKGTTLLEFRPVFEMLGMKVHWDHQTKRITGTKDSLTIQLTINEKNAYVNGMQMTLPQAPSFRGGKTWIPLRFVAEASGKKVLWDRKTRMIIINDGKFTQADFTFTRNDLNKGLLDELRNGILGPFTAEQKGKSLAEIVNKFGFPEIRHDGTPESDDIPFITYGDYLLYYLGEPGSHYLSFPKVRSIHISLPESTTNLDIIRLFGNQYTLDYGMYVQMIYKIGKYHMYVQTTGEGQNDHPYFLSVE